MLPVVSLVGRPNVGKSTLFNALTGTRDALVADRPGVTRDRHYGICRREEIKPFVLVDTGGLTGEDTGLAGLTEKQSLAAIDESNVIVFMVDARDGLLPHDREIAQKLRSTGKPILLGVNKTDGLNPANALAEFSVLGFAEVILLAASHRHGMHDLMEAIAPHLPSDSPLDEEKLEGVRVAIIGRPNVGKSTLVNRLLGEDRMIASEVAGTTRDSIAVPLERDGQKYVLIDTAGVRRKAKVEDAVEKFSVIKTLQAMENANVAVLMIDATEGVTDQDATVLGHALEAGRALVVAVNKWDGLTPYQRERCTNELDRKLDFVAYAERLFISAKHGTAIGDLMKAVMRAYRSATKDIPSSKMTEALELALQSYQPPLHNGRAPKLRYAHLGGRNPPRIIIHGNRLEHLADGYKRYLENFFRKQFKLVGTPIRIETRTGDNPFEGKKNVLTERQVKKRKRLMTHVRGKR